MFILFALFQTRAHDTGLESWLSGLKHLRLLQKTQVQSLAPLWPLTTICMKLQFQEIRHPPLASLDTVQRWCTYIPENKHSYTHEIKKTKGLKLGSSCLTSASLAEIASMCHDTWLRKLLQTDPVSERGTGRARLC